MAGRHGGPGGPGHGPGGPGRRPPRGGFGGPGRGFRPPPPPPRHHHHYGPGRYRGGCMMPILMVLGAIIGAILLLV